MDLFRSIRREMQLAQDIINSEGKSLLKVSKCSDNYFLCHFRARPTDIAIRCFISTNYSQKTMAWYIDDDRVPAIDFPGRRFSFTRNFMRIVFQLCQKHDKNFPPSMRKLNTTYYTILMQEPGAKKKELPTASPKELCSGCKKCWFYIPRIVCGKQNHLIKENAKYYLVEKMTICQDCYAKTKHTGTHIELVNRAIKESFINCKECGAYWHQVCALHIDQIWTSGFVCSKCLENRGQKRLENIYTAKNLPTNKLSDFLENRVKKFLKENGMDATEITIRVVSAAENITLLSESMRSYFKKKGRYIAIFPYVRKFILIFHEIDGQEVCHYGLNVQEYDSESPKPNQRCVYIAYTDCLPLLFRAFDRFNIFRQVLLGYMEYLRQLGYSKVYVWPRKTSLGEEHIFYAHPPERCPLKLERLPNFYLRMLNAPGTRNVIANYSVINRNNFKIEDISMRKIPYFSGDIMKATIDEILEEHKGELSEIENEDEVDNFIESEILIGLAEKIDKEDLTYITIDLEAYGKASSKEIIHDPNDLYPSKIMGSRNSFFNFASRRNLEFSSIRRANYSTMVILYELHREREDDRGSDKIRAHENFGIRLIAHANICLNGECIVHRCKVTRKMLKHFRICSDREQCFSCCQVRKMAWDHATHCSAYSCKIPHCALLKNRLRLNEAKRKLTQQISHRVL